MAPPGDEVDRVPVTILTGFLGSGKTTLFNHILTASHGKKIAIIQNEFGETGIDDKLMEKNAKFACDEEIFEVLNGCVCCSVRTDLVKVLQKLAAREKAGTLMLDAIVIETTGMADPAPVAQTFLADPVVREFARLDGVVTLVDAKHIEQHLDEVKESGAINEAVCQVAFADRLLLNKTDLVPTEKALARVEARLRAVNSFAPIVRCTRSAVPLDEVLGIHGFDLQRTLQRDPTFMDVGRKPTKHDSTVTSHSIDQGAPRHLRGVKKGELDLQLVQEWIGTLLQERGEDFYRMKGVLAIAHSEQRFVFHAVHMVMDGSFEAPWAEGEPRESKLVFIGKNIDPKELSASFDACLSTPGLLAERLAELRFKVGDSVECNEGDRWTLGKVIALMYRDDGLPPGQIAPYQVKLASGDSIYAPGDDDSLIRVPRRRSGRLQHLGTGADAEEEEHDCGHDRGHGEVPPAASSKRTRGTAAGSSLTHTEASYAAEYTHDHSHGHAGAHDHGHVHDEHCQHGGDDEDAAGEHSHAHSETKGRDERIKKMRKKESSQRAKKRMALAAVVTLGAVAVAVFG